MQKINLGLLLASCVAGLALCELSLRLFYPRYRDLAEAPFRPHESRIWARTPNARNLQPHPDTRLAHALHHNNFALRQHRNFSAADLASAVNIGVFGDSFVENVGMDAPYSFTEPLDWLLNQGPERFNVLNFGVVRYGPGQSFLHYESFRYAEDLDWVFFVYCSTNDLQDILGTALFDLDGAGRLVRNERSEATRSPWWVRFISGLHVSYLILDVSGGSFFSNPEASLVEERRWRNARRRQGTLKNGTLEKGEAILRLLVRRWKRAVEENGGRFVTVLLPDYPADSRITTLLEEEDVEVLNLYDCFQKHDDGHGQWEQSPYRFKRDQHWNENGNRLAAVCLHRFLEQEMRLSGMSEDALQETLHQYYSAFGGWTPPAPPGEGADAGEASPGRAARTAAGIREKYQALGDLEHVREYVRELVQAPEKRIIRSNFDVYLDGKRLVYVKDDCSKTDMGRLLLMATSVDGRNFLEDVYDSCCRRLQITMIDGELCIASRMLPDYPVAHVVTAMFPWGDYAPVWQAEAVIDRAARDAFRQALEKAVAPGKLVIRSDFDVYLDGKWLTYVRDVCSPSALSRGFFLHVTPADDRDLPEGREYDHQYFHRVGVHVDELGCVVRRRLPGYAVRHVRTGQTVQVEGIRERVWEGEFSLPVSSSRAEPGA